MRTGIGASISVGLLLLCVGCGKPAPVGTWRGEREFAVTPGTDPVIAAQLRRVVLKIDEDGRGVLEDGGVTFEGLVTRAGDRLRFEVLAVAGVNIARQPPELPRELSFELEGEALRFKETRLAPSR